MTYLTLCDYRCDFLSNGKYLKWQIGIKKKELHREVPFNILIQNKLLFQSTSFGISINNYFSQSQRR
jgi:hypothetical protein